MSIINTQATADARKVRTGKDGALYNGKGKTSGYCRNISGADGSK